MNDDTTNLDWTWAVGLGVLAAILLITGSLATDSQANLGNENEPEACSAGWLSPVPQHLLPGCHVAERFTTHDTPPLDHAPSPQSSSTDTPLPDPTCGARDAIEKCEAWTSGKGYKPVVGPDSETVYIIDLDDNVQAVDMDTGDPVWTGTPDLAQVYDVKVTPDAETVVAVGTTIEDGEKKLGVAGLDADTGEPVFSTDSFDGRIPLLALGPDGERFYVASISPENPATEENIQVHAFNQSTTELAWTTFWNGPKDRFEQPLGIEVDPDGSQVYVAGNTRMGARSFFVNTQPYAAVTLAFDAATGEQAWEKIYKGPGAATQLPSHFGRADVLEVSPDGERVHIAGNHKIPYGRNALDPMGHQTEWIRQYVTIAYDAETGEREWFADFRANPIALDESEARFTGMSVGEDGRVFLTGAKSPSSSVGLYSSWKTVAFDGVSGNRLWTSTFDTPGVHWEVPWDIEAGPHGDQVYVYGESSLEFVLPGVFSTVAYDAETGEEAWRAHEGDTFATESAPAGTTAVLPYPMDVSEDGTTVVTGAGTVSQATLERDTFVNAYRTGVSGSSLPVDGATSGSGEWQR